MEQFEFNHSNRFVVEKEFKIGSIDKLRENNAFLKQYNIKLSDIEDEFVNKKKISLNGVRALCIIYEVSITILRKYTYYDFSHGNKGGQGVIEMSDTLGVYYKTVDISNIIKTKWLIENPNKPIRAISGYTLQELRDLSVELHIDIDDKMTKKTLYEKIKDKIE